ncbi:hypothetical protein KP509_1Z146700, partial [Ceratopteris richardii]
MAGESGEWSYGREGSNFPRRPGLSTAGSTVSGLFVAPIKNTPFCLSAPSISLNNLLSTLSATAFPSVPRLGARASISSKKMMH